MQFKLVLQQQQANTLLPFNYQYPLSSAIYKIIRRADSEFAYFLHNKGYGEGGKNFKLFTFSDLQTLFTVQGDRMKLTNKPVELRVCFHVTEAAENFIRGLFLQQELEIADNKSKATFVVQQVESLPTMNGLRRTEPDEVMLQPLSPLVAGRKNERGHYDYRSPSDGDFADCIRHNLAMKYLAANAMDTALLLDIKRQLAISVIHGNRPYRQRLITIKQGTPYETKVRGYTGFRLQVQAPKPMIELALNAGLGLYNSQGMGCVGESHAI